jgi:hypothetical protein
MSLDDQFDSTTNQAVNDALAAKHADQGSQPGLPSTLRTTGGGETLSPYTQESLGTSFIGEHGSIATSYNIERTIQGTQSLESLASGLKDVRVGGTGPNVSSNGSGRVVISNSPANYTMLNNARVSDSFIPDVGNRFSR